MMNRGAAPVRAASSRQVFPARFVAVSGRSRAHSVLAL